ncbi:hypothetical protein AVEN_170794-1 [Araneus ventricosus]|uniref:Uncharacterized protein n=1 Tax=Araneus ventricosus TaxID=182803 RepID=A0A4Y2PH91_ARAVE|nr:hypothetical protein AVEN_170794-1 [Araneus ventricosus]
MKGYAQSLGILQTQSVPGINTQLLYPYLLISHYKKSTPECPALCAFFQTLIGLCHLYGKDGLFGGHLLFKPAVFFYKAEAVQAVLGNTENIEKSREYRFMRPWLGTGLTTSPDSTGNAMRVLLVLNMQDLDFRTQFSQPYT